MRIVPGRMSLVELRNYFLRGTRVPSRDLLRRLDQDPRQGAQQIAALARRRRQLAERERRRMHALLALERSLWEQGLERVAGVDEVGVGPLAGPVVAAAVTFPPGTYIAGLKDSKQLLREERVELAESIRRQAQSISIAQATVAEVNALNPYHAALLAMRRAVEGLEFRPQQVLVDARTIPEIDIPQRSVIQGDEKHFSIAAASVIAKEWRDGLMRALDRRYPGYGFACHKGYSTPQHQAAIRQLGPCELHRESYSFVQELAGNCSHSFYRLKGLINELDTRNDLVSLRRDMLLASDLAPSEVRKLRLLLHRRSRRLPQPTQMKLL